MDMVGGPGHKMGYTTRRVPAQSRSRQRVEQVLEATAELVLESGVDGVTASDIARAAKVPVASIYQYFDGKDAVLLALMQRDLAELDAEVAQAVAEADTPDIAALVDELFDRFVWVYRRRPALVQVYLRGRTNPAIFDFGRDHNAAVAANMREVAIARNLVVQDLDHGVAEFATVMSDRVLQLAFEHDQEGDPYVIDEGRTMIVSYLENYAPG